MCGVSYCQHFKFRRLFLHTPDIQGVPRPGCVSLYVNAHHHVCVTSHHHALQARLPNGFGLIAPTHSIGVVQSQCSFLMLFSFFSFCFFKFVVLLLYTPELRSSAFRECPKNKFSGVGGFPFFFFSREGPSTYKPLALGHPILRDLASGLNARPERHLRPAGKRGGDTVITLSATSYALDVGR